MNQSLATPESYYARRARFRMRSRIWISLFGLVFLTLPVGGCMLLLAYDECCESNRGDYPSVAPEADFQTRRAWGRKQMFEYFEITEKWVRRSSLIVQDIGPVTGVAPIDGPNRFREGGFTDGSYCTMKLQVIGKTGEGLLTLPKVNVNRMGQLYEISRSSTWKFGDKTDQIQLSGKSWLQESGLDVLVAQLREHSENNEHEYVVATFELLSSGMNDAVEPGSIQRAQHTGLIAGMPQLYRRDILQRYTESLSQLEPDEGANKAF